MTVSNVTAGVSFTETFREAVWRKEFKSRDAELYRVMVERSDNSQVYSVTYRTDLTLFTGFPDYGASISLLEETAGWGNDEIRAVLEDDRGDAFAQWFWPEMDANEGMPLFVTMPFVRSAQLYVAELADEEGAAVNYFSVDESARVPISPLSSEKENQLGIVKTFSLCELPPNQADCQGKLQLRYNLVHSLDP